MRVLVIEDHPKMAGTLQEGLRGFGFDVELAPTGYAGEDCAVAQDHDVILLDLMLPDRDGVEVCRNLRRRGVHTPVLMLTALSETSDKVVGLDAGADDYLTKPFDFAELVARIRALIRRTPSEPINLRYEDVELDLAKRFCAREGRAIGLTPKEFALLEFFLRNPERVLTRAAIGQHVWDAEFDPYSNVIDVYISMLRRKVDKPFERPLIHTVVGSGYMLSAAAPAASA